MIITYIAVGVFGPRRLMIVPHQPADPGLLILTCRSW